MKTIRQAKWCYIGCSILLIALGLLLALFPRFSQITVCYILGGLTVLYGLSKIFGYLSHDLYNLAFQFDLALGVFIAAIGLVMLLIPGRIIAVFPVVVGLFVMIEGVFRLQTAIDAKRFGLTAWWLILAGGILCTLLGAVLLFDPFGGGDALTVFLGVVITADGLQNLFNGFYTVKIRKSGADYTVNGKEKHL